MEAWTNKGFGEVSVNDIAPSVLNLFGIPIPTSMDGKSFFEDYKPPIFRDELREAVFKRHDKKLFYYRIQAQKSHNLI